MTVHSTEAVEDDVELEIVSEGRKFWMELEKIATIPEMIKYILSQKPDNLKNWIQKVRIAHTEISADQIMYIRQILTKFSHLEEFEFRDCKMSSTMTTLDQDIRNLKITTFSVTAMKEIDLLISAVCKNLKTFDSKGLNIEESVGNERLLAKLLEGLKGSQVSGLRKLDLSYNRNIVDFMTLGQILFRGITELKMVNCDLETKQLQDMCKKLSDSKVNYLDISYNPDLTEDDIALLPKILCRDRVKFLSLRGCELSDDELEGFENTSFGNLRITKIDLSRNPSLLPEGVEIVGRMVKKLHTSHLALAGCDLDGECLDALTSSLDGYTLKCLDVKGNIKIGGHVPKIVNLLNTSGIKCLDISDCRLATHQISMFADMLGDRKLTSLNLSDSERRIDASYIQAICKMMPLVTKELVVCFPYMAEEFGETLRKCAARPQNRGPRLVLQSSKRRKTIGYLTVMGTA